VRGQNLQQDSNILQTYTPQPEHQLKRSNINRTPHNYQTYTPQPSTPIERAGSDIWGREDCNIGWNINKGIQVPTSIE